MCTCNDIGVRVLHGLKINNNFFNSIFKVKQLPISRHNLPKVVINEPDPENKSQSTSSISDNSIASSCNPSPIPVIREEGGSINEAFIMDSDSNDDENNESIKKSEVLEMLI